MPCLHVAIREDDVFGVDLATMLQDPAIIGVQPPAVWLSI